MENNTEKEFIVADEFSIMDEYRKLLV